MRVLALTLAVALAAAAQAPIDKPNPVAKRRLLERAAAAAGLKSPARSATTSAVTGPARLLVVLVEFAGTDRFDFIPTGPERSTWDPFGQIDSSEWTGTVGDCRAIVSKYNITAPRTFTYSGPLHNAIERPRSASDASGSLIWAEDFTPDYYRHMLFGSGLQIQYKRQDGSTAQSDTTGYSMRNYYLDASMGSYEIGGDVVGWVQVPHSVWWYGAEPCPGRRSGSSSAETDGGIPGAGTLRTLVGDALEAVKAANPDLDWRQYDADGDGLIDHLVIVHAGLGEEANGTLVNRTNYGEAGLWSVSSSLGVPYPVMEGVAADAFILLPENAALGVIAHEYGHNIGADDVYNLAGTGTESASVWTLMADTWVGNPSGTTPSMFDPHHLDLFGWLQPLVIDDPSKEYRVTIGQTSNFQPGPDIYRGVRIQLPDGAGKLNVQPAAGYHWWGGQRDAALSSMTLKSPVQLPADQPAQLTFDVAYEIEQRWDLLMVQLSPDGGTTWSTLANEHTTCQMVGGWSGIGLLPGDLCAAGIQGFTGKSPGYPARVRESFDLSAFAGQAIQLRFVYFTDTAYNEDGPFLDNVAVTSGSEPVFNDDAEATGDNWDYSGAWERNDGSILYRQSFLLQWRNTGAEGGFDSALSNPNWSVGPFNTGLLVWYQNGRYSNNDIRKRLFDPPSFGPKGYLLLVDAHPAPYRHTSLATGGFANEGANHDDRSQLRDAPFSLAATQSFSYFSNNQWITVSGRPGVATFSDATSYYPGLEAVSQSPKVPALAWITADWNTSVVLPATGPYPAKAVGYRAGDPIQFNCSANSSAGTLNCAGAGTLATDGGNGTPAGAGGHYGWNVEILEQTATQAKLRIWNSRGR
ncbi:MAG: immune inhibitor A [Acidobacteria bacterium]|nr:immune inhibitor A [Acidobacteriota bacterium]